MENKVRSDYWDALRPQELLLAIADLLNNPSITPETILEMEKARERIQQSRSDFYRLPDGGKGIREVLVSYKKPA